MNTNARNICMIVLIGVSALAAVRAGAAPPPITYQGQLKLNGVPVTDTANFKMSIWSRSTGGSRVSGIEPVGNVNVVNGLFTIQLMVDTEPTAIFSDGMVYLEVAVAVPAGTNFVLLEPRQPITPAPYALYAFDAPGGGGGSVWSTSGNDIYYTGGGVAIGLISPGFPLHVQASATHVIHGVNQSSTNFTSGVYGESAGSNGYGVHGNAPAGSGNATGVFGEAISAGGRGVSGKVTHATGTWAHGVYGEASGTIARGVFGQNTSTTGPAWGVFGQTTSVEGHGVQGLASAVTGTAVGVFGGTNSPDGYAGKFYGGRNYFEGNVGFGTTNPEYPLHAVGASGGPVVFARASGASSGAFYGVADGSMSGVRGESNGTSGIGVSGKAWSETGMAVGVKGVTLSSEGIGVKGENTAGGWAGYFTGRAYVSGRMGIGTNDPAAKLDVVGTVRATAFSNTGATMEVTNSGNAIGSHAIKATIDNGEGYSDAAAGYFSSVGAPGSAIIARSSASSTVYARNTGSNYAFYGLSEGTGAKFIGNGSPGQGVHAVAGGSLGTALYAESTGHEGTAVFAKSTGDRGVAVYARSASDQPSIVIRNAGSGSLIEARNSVNSMVFRVTNDGSTKVKLLEITGGADLAEPFDVAGPTAAKPGMVVCIDAHNAGKLIVSGRAYDRAVAGVISGAGGIEPGMIMGQEGSIAHGKHPVALTGRVWVYCDATAHRITPGDLLTTSDIAGHAMKVTEYGKAQGAIIGKAMTPLNSGRGLVLVLVSLQ